MIFKLGKNIQVGHKIKTSHGWRKVLSISDKGAQVKEGDIKYGDTVYGWRLK